MTASAYDRLIDALGNHGSRIRHRGAGQASAQCPAHEDREPSLSVTAIEGQALIYCHGGCDTLDVLANIGWSMSDLFDKQGSAVYQYDSGRTVKRWYDRKNGRKKFAQSGDLDRCELYHLRRLRNADNGSVFLVEGEKDVHAIEAAGGVATTAPQGATNFGKVDVSPLAGKYVTAVVDRDSAGAGWAATVAAKLDGIAAGLRFVQARTGKDAADHIAAGHSLNDFEVIDPPRPAATVEGPRQRLGEGATPFKAGHGYASRFPTDRLPASMRDYVHDIAERKQVPVDLPALMMLGIASSVAAPRITIRRDHDWRQPTNLYVACALDSASGKSPVMEELRRGLLRAQRQIADQHKENVARLIKELGEQVEAELKTAQDIKTGFDEREARTANAKRLSQQVEELVTNPPPAPELLYDGDLSVEALAMAMAENGGAGPVIDDEGTFLRNLGGQYSGKTGNLGLMLVGYDCRYYKPRRVNRATAPIDRAALSLVIAPQPSIIADMKHNQTMNDLGFINRFIVSVPGDLIGLRVGRQATWVDDMPTGKGDRRGRQWWSELLLSLSEYEVIGSRDEEECATLDLTYEAFKLHYEYADELESRMGLDGDLRTVKSWASKEAGRCLRVAAVLHLAAGFTTDDRVSEETMDNAIGISRWSTEHFLHAGSVVGLSEGADRIKEYIDGTENGFATRTAISRDLFKGNAGAKSMDAYVGELVRTGCFVVEKAASTGGRAPLVVRRVAPDA